jgi:hypothetical protein
VGAQAGPELNTVSLGMVRFSMIQFSIERATLEGKIAFAVLVAVAGLIAWALFFRKR